MTFIWLIVWVLSNTPHVALSGPDAWNTWTILLVVAIVIDFTSGGSRL